MSYDPQKVGCRGNWYKYEGNPVLGEDKGFCFDNHVLKIGDKYRMYFSWRNYYSIAYTESDDGLAIIFFRKCCCKGLEIPICRALHSGMAREDSEPFIQVNAVFGLITFD